MKTLVLLQDDFSIFFKFILGKISGVEEILVICDDDSLYYLWTKVLKTWKVFLSGKSVKLRRTKIYPAYDKILVGEDEFSLEEFKEKYGHLIF